MTKPSPILRYDTTFVKRVAEFNLPCTAHHWQLQDCVVCPDNRSTIYALNDYYVHKFNQNHCQVERTPHRFDFKSVSLNVGFGYSVTSSETGEISLYNSALREARTYHIGKDINNHIAFSRNPQYLDATAIRSIEPHLLACNNDGHIRVLSLPDLRILQKLPFHQSVNHAAVSPDGTRMVAVTDDQAVPLFDARGTTYTPALNFNTRHGAAYSCHWDAFSTTFAVATNSGYVDVFDVRNPQHKLASVRALQPAQQGGGSCRVVKFAPSYTVDLMAFSEHTNYVTVVDTRNYTDVQRLRVGNNQIITGLAFTPDGGNLFVGTGDRIIKFAVNQTDRRSFGSYELA